MKLFALLLIAIYISGFSQLNPSGAFGPTISVAVTHSHEHEHYAGSDHGHSHEQNEDSAPAGDSHGEKAPHSHSVFLNAQAFSIPVSIALQDCFQTSQTTEFRITVEQPPKAPALFGIFRPPIRS